MTGWGTEVCEELARSRGVSAVLRKPFPAESFFVTVQNLVQQRRDARKAGPT